MTSNSVCKNCGFTLSQHNTIIGGAVGPNRTIICPTALFAQNLSFHNLQGVTCGCVNPNQPNREDCGPNRCICRCHAEARRKEAP